jgi:hypothetical protein
MVDDAWHNLRDEKNQHRCEHSHCDGAVERRRGSITAIACASQWRTVGNLRRTMPTSVAGAKAMLGLQASAKYA